MARVHVSKFAGRKGATLMCQSPKGQHPIAVGESYSWVKPRSAYRKMVRCLAHPFRLSETTTSKMAGVYAAQETAQDDLTAMTGNPASVEDISSVLETAADDIESVAEEYREANEASPTGLVFGEDLNERADEISEAAQELRDWSADEDEPDYDQCEAIHEGDEEADGEDVFPARGSDECESCMEIKGAWWDEQVDSAMSAVNDLSI